MGMQQQILSATVACRFRRNYIHLRLQKWLWHIYTYPVYIDSVKLETKRSDSSKKKYYFCPWAVSGIAAQVHSFNGSELPCCVAWLCFWKKKSRHLGMCTSIKLYSLRIYIWITAKIYSDTYHGVPVLRQ